MSRPLSLVVALCAVIGLSPLAVASPIVYTTTLSGPAEDPPNASPGTGTATVTFDPDAHTLRVEVSFSGLLSPTTVAHIHAPTALPFTGVAGVATTTPTFPGFPAGVTSGSYDMTFDTLAATTYRPGFITANGGTTAGAEAALGSALASGRAYVNVHTQQFPAGEIRGFLVPAAIPEPATLGVFGAWALGLAAFARRRNARAAE